MEGGIAQDEVTGLQVTPASSEAQSGQTRQFTALATLRNGTTQSNPPVAWSTTGGLINTSGLFTAGTVLGTFPVIARAVSGVADTSYVTVAQTVVTALIVSPQGATVVTGRTQQYTASARLSNGGTLSDPAVTWAATGGIITSGGVFTAGVVPGPFQVNAIMVGVPGDTVAVNVVAAPPPGQPGNLFSFSFENGTFGGLTDGSGGAPDNYSIVTGGAYDGSKFAEASIPASSSDGSSNMYWDGGAAYSDLWVVVAIKVVTPPSAGLATQKMVIFREAGFGIQLGEMNQVGGTYIWSWLDGSLSIDISAAGSIASTAGQWNVWKFHLDQRGSRPLLTVGLNGRESIFATTKAGAKAADPSIIDFGGTLNGGSGSSRFGFDYIQIGTVDPGWP